MGGFCPAIPEWWKSDVFRPFYQELVPFGDPDFRATPAAPLENRQVINGVEYVTCAGNRWRDAGIPIQWTPGPISQFPLSEPHIMSDHWHTSFTVRTHSVHIDFVSFLRGGPRTGYREYRVYCDEEEIKRGGGYAGFIGGNFTHQRNWPLAVEIEDHLIYINRLLQWWPESDNGKISAEAVCSVWVRVDNEYS